MHRLHPVQRVQELELIFFRAEAVRLVLPDLLDLYTYLNAYIERHREVLLGRAHNPGRFSSRPSKRRALTLHTIKQHSTRLGGWQFSATASTIRIPGAVPSRVCYRMALTTSEMSSPTHIHTQTVSCEQASMPSRTRLTSYSSTAGAFCGRTRQHWRRGSSIGYGRQRSVADASLSRLQADTQTVCVRPKHNLSPSLFKGLGPPACEHFGCEPVDRRHRSYTLFSRHVRKGAMLPKRICTLPLALPFGAIID